jgi:hypothetical protein
MGRNANRNLAETVCTIKISNEIKYHKKENKRKLDLSVKNKIMNEFYVAFFVVKGPVPDATDAPQP